MRFQLDEEIAHPAGRVYTALRDRTPDLVPFLPEVDRIETVERVRQPDGRLRLTNVWQGNRKSAPRAARPFLTKQMMRWRDVATWDDDELSLHWRFETMHLESLFKCHGSNHFESMHNGACRFVVSGTIETYPERVPGVPNSMGRKLAPKADRWLVNMLVPNISRLPGALNELLAE